MFCRFLKEWSYGVVLGDFGQGGLNAVSATAVLRLRGLYSSGACRGACRSFREQGLLRRL